MLHFPCACGAFDVLLGVAHEGDGSGSAWHSAGILAMPCKLIRSGPFWLPL